MNKEDKLITILTVIFVFAILISIGLGIEYISKKFCELRGGRYISGSQNSMCRFD